MSQVTTGAETWAAHTHRHHAAAAAWIFGPAGPTDTTGPFPVVAAPTIGAADFLFWNAAGAQGGGLAYPAGQLTPSPTPVFPAGSEAGSVIAWYAAHGGPNGGRPGLVVDALLETAGNWIDWDATNDPFTVTRGSRGPQPDNDDTVYTDGDEAVVTAAEAFPGTFPAANFDQWLVFGGNIQVSHAFAVYRRPGRFKIPWVPPNYDPWWWLKNSPVEFVANVREILAAQPEVSQIATLLDISSAISDRELRAAVQRSMYESLITSAQRQLEAGKELPGRKG